MATKKPIGPRPDNPEWGPGRTHDGPPKGDAPAEDLHRRGDATTTPDKEGVEIEPHLRAALAEVEAGLAGMQCVGRDAGQSVRDALGSDRERIGHIRRALRAGSKPAQILAVIGEHNSRGEFAVGNDSVGAAAWAAVRALSSSAPAGTDSTPSSNPIDPATQRPYIPTTDAAEAIARAKIGIGIQGNGLTPEATEAGRLAAREGFGPPGYENTHPDVRRLVFANSLDDFARPMRASQYAGLQPQDVVNEQTGRGKPSGE